MHCGEEEDAVQHECAAEVVAACLSGVEWHECDRRQQQCENKCGGCDTVYSNFVTVACQPTSGINTIIKGEPKMLGMYDMLGRPVKHMRKDEIIIFLYDDGSTKKIIQN